MSNLFLQQILTGLINSTIKPDLVKERLEELVKNLPESDKKKIFDEIEKHFAQSESSELPFKIEDLKELVSKIWKSRL